MDICILMTDNIHILVRNNGVKAATVKLFGAPDASSSVQLSLYPDGSDASEIMARLGRKGFKGYLFYFSAPELLPIPYTCSDQEKGFFLRAIVKEPGDTRINAWHADPICFKADKYVKFDIPAKCEFVMGFRTDEPNLF